MKAQFSAEKAQLQADTQTLQMKNDLISQSLQEQKTLMSEAREQQEDLTERMNVQFEVLAQKIFEEKSAKFTDQNHKNILSVLEPLERAH